MTALFGSEKSLLSILKQVEKYGHLIEDSDEDEKEEESKSKGAFKYLR